MSSDRDDEADAMEAHAAAELGVEQEGAALHDVERCPACNRPMDDIEDKSEETLLAELRVCLLRDLLRGFRDGTITHQEKAILRGLLRDNNSRVPVDPFKGNEPHDEYLPEPSRHRTALPSQDDFDNTDGG